MKSRQQKIENYGKAYEKLSASLKDIPRKMWKFKPSPSEWSIHEIIVHLADTEANAFVRCMKTIAEPKGTIMPMDQEVWAENLYYGDQDADTSLQVFKYLREKTYFLLTILPIETWGNQFNHPESGLQTLDAWLDNYEEHGDSHIEQIKRVYSQWRTVKS